LRADSEPTEALRTVSRRDWRHGEARCPSCGLHLSPFLDLDDYIRKNADARASGVTVTHRRCDATFRITFIEP
jgi:phage terminase large subunit GpA-like protein